MPDETLKLLRITDGLWLSAEQELRDVRELLADLAALTTWMTGSADFSPEGQAYVEWERQKPALDRALAYLAEEAELERQTEGPACETRRT